MKYLTILIICLLSITSFAIVEVPTFANAIEISHYETGTNSIVLFPSVAVDSNTNIVVRLLCSGANGEKFIVVNRDVYGSSYVDQISLHSSRTNIVDLYHVWWETGNYDASVIARFREEDAARAERYGDRTDAWGIEHAKPKYAGITTNTVHWMKAHKDTSGECPYLIFTGWHRYGWIRLFWRESLTSGDWKEIASTGTQYQGINTFKVHFHPTSDVTKSIVSGRTSFFRMSDGFYTSSWNHNHYPTSRIFSMNYTGLFQNQVTPIKQTQSVSTTPSSPPSIP